MKKMAFVGAAALLLLVAGCKDDLKDALVGDNNGGVDNNGTNNANNDNNGGVDGPQRPDPGRPGNGGAASQCEVASDCDLALPLGCDEGRWRCVNNSCLAECEHLACTYQCDLDDCQCKLDDRGCEIPECAEDCDALAAEIESSQHALRACDADEDTCSVVENADCGIAGGCYLLLSSAADPEPVRLLRIRYAQSQCQAEGCACDEIPAEAVCVGGQCKLPGDDSCEAPSDCEGLPHDACEGEWACADSACVWECAGVDCEELGQAVADEQAAVTACDEEDTCVATLNNLCGGVGDCYIYHAADADLSALEGLEANYSDGACQEAECDCGEAPALECLNGTCQPAQE